MKSYSIYTLTTFIFFLGCSTPNISEAWIDYQNSDYDIALSKAKYFDSDSSKHLVGNIYQLKGDYVHWLFFQSIYI